MVLASLIVILWSILYGMLCGKIMALMDKWKYGIVMGSQVVSFTGEGEVRATAQDKEMVTVNVGLGSESMRKGERHSMRIFCRPISVVLALTKKGKRRILWCNYVFVQLENHFLLI